jgi:hypothetical protein
LCLKHILYSPFFECAGSAGVWLPPVEGFDAASPSLADIKTIDINLLSASLDAFLFRHLPAILAQRRDQVQWHLNPACKSCKFASECEEQTVDTGQLGVIPNLAVEDARVLKDLLRIGRRYLEPTVGTLTDIEELYKLVNHDDLLKRISSRNSTTVKKARHLLAVPRRKRLTSATASPVVEAAISRKIQVRVCNHPESIAVIKSTSRLFLVSTSLARLQKTLQLYYLSSPILPRRTKPSRNFASLYMPKRTCRYLVSALALERSLSVHWQLSYRLSQLYDERRSAKFLRRSSTFGQPVIELFSRPILYTRLYPLRQRQIIFASALAPWLKGQHYCKQRTNPCFCQALCSPFYQRRNG